MNVVHEASTEEVPLSRATGSKAKAKANAEAEANASVEAEAEADEERALVSTLEQTIARARQLVSSYETMRVVVRDVRGGTPRDLVPNTTRASQRRRTVRRRARGSAC